MKPIEYKIFNNVDDYVKDQKNKHKHALNLSDKDVKICQNLIPFNKKMLSPTNNKKIVPAPLFNVSSVFNEANNFSSKGFNELESSFKVSIGFLIGMIMAIVYADKELNSKEIYHYNFKKSYITGMNSNKKPDFLTHNILNNKYYLIEAKGSSVKRVERKAVKNGFEQLSINSNSSVANNNVYYKGQKIDHRYVVATGFRKNNDINLNIIDPDIEDGIDPIKCIKEMYSNIDFKDIAHSKAESENHFYLINSDMEGIEVTIGLYKGFDKEELSEYKDNWEIFSKTLLSNYVHFNKKYKDIIFYNGIMIAYNKK